MKRDWELIRRILLAIEERPTPEGAVEPRTIGDDQLVISHHMRLLRDAGLIEAVCREGSTGPMYCVATGLTWDGYELLDRIRSDTVWQRTASLLRERGVDFSIEAIHAASATVIKGLLS